MIGSISKIRPCGHHHHYKYSSCVNVDDFSRIDRDYKSDIDENGLWYFNTDNVINCADLLRDSSNIIEVKLNLPNATTIAYSLRGSKVKKVFVDAPKVTNLNGVIYHCRNLEEFKMPDSSNVTDLGYFAETTTKWLNISGLDFSNVTSITNGFNCNTGYLTNSKIEADLSNVATATRAFIFRVLTELKYPVDENGVCIYNKGAGKQAIINGIPQYKYNTFPNLSAGDGMFGGSRLDKKSTISILESLPAYTSGSHPINIGIHIDHKYDPEVNVALKKCQNDYITPIEELGATLPEEITTDKGWTLSVQWNGTKTDDAYPAPTV